MTDTDATGRRRRLFPLSIPISVVAALVVGCTSETSEAGSEEPPDGSVSLSVLAFTSSASGWNASIPAFTATDGGAGITVKTTYGPSPELADMVRQGDPADIVYLADQPSVNSLVLEEKIAPDWDTGPHGGQPFGSITTLVVRAGNPLNIHTWNDLLRPGIQVIAANPVLSGSGKWGLMAAYASASDGGQNEEAGVDYLNKLILEHVVVGPTTVTESIDLFLAGTGDVLIAPENSALAAEGHSAAIERVVPPQTLKIDSQAAIVAASRHPDEAKRLLEFLYTPEAQRLWAEAGFRPVLPDVAQEFAADFPAPRRLWTIEDVGGWAVVGPKFFDPENGIVSRIFEQATA
ncbi:MAG: extracellular solute-binding protein [Mycobacterium sp.]